MVESFTENVRFYQVMSSVLLNVQRVYLTFYSKKLILQKEKYAIVTLNILNGAVVMGPISITPIKLRVLWNFKIIYTMGFVTLAYETFKKQKHYTKLKITCVCMIVVYKL